jgi:hypothetical protein
MSTDPGFRRPVAPYPDSDVGVSLRMMVMPVDRPRDAPAEPRVRRRRSPGDPSCPDCQDSPRGACGEHASFHAEVDPLGGLPGTRRGGPFAPDDRVRDWRPV